MSEGRVDVIATPDEDGQIWFSIEALDDPKVNIWNYLFTPAEARYVSNELRGALWGRDQASVT